MKILEIWARFWVKRCFWVEKGTKEAKRLIWKTVTICPLKTKNLLISQVSYLWSYSRNGLLCTKHVSREVSSYERVPRKSRNSLCKFMEKLKLASSFSRVGFYSQHIRENAFEWVFQQKQNWLFGKTLNTQKFIKTLTKTYKILKNLFGFDHQAIEYTYITFEHIQSHK